MTTAQLDELRSNTLRALASFKNFHGVYSCISDKRHLESALTMQLRTAACPDAVFDERLESKLDQEFDAKHELMQALELSIDLLPETTRRRSAVSAAALGCSWHAPFAQHAPMFSRCPIVLS